MNEIKIDIHKKFDGIDAIKDRISNHQNSKKSYNFPLSPKNKIINSLNLGNINSRKNPKNISKDNSSDKTLLDKKKMNKKNISYNNLNDSKINNTNKVNNIKVKGNLELKEKDINNFKDFQKLKDSNNDIYFRKGSLTNRLGPILFSNNSTKNNILLKAGQNMIHHFDSLKLKNGSEESNKIEKELKQKPLIVKLDPKRESNEKGKSMNKKENSRIKFEDKEEIKRIKTPTKKIFIESDRNNRECLSDIFYLNKNVIDFNGDKSKIKNLEKIKIISPEENHFKAVLYSQEIKRFNKALE